MGTGKRGDVDVGEGARGNEAVGADEGAGGREDAGTSGGGEGKVGAGSVEAGEGPLGFACAREVRWMRKEWWGGRGEYRGGL